MKYQPPYGQPDPNASYVNGDPSRGIQGSIPPAAAFEQPMREVVGVIEKSGFTQSDDDLLQLATAVRSQRLNYAVDTGTANALFVAFDPPIIRYQAGLTLHVRVKVTNGPGQVLINAGAGAVPIRKTNGADVAEGEMPAGAIALLIHDGTAFQLANVSASSGGITLATVDIPYCIDQSVTPGTIIANFTPQLQPLVAGSVIAVKIANTAPGPTRIIIDGNAPIDLQPNGGGRMLQGDVTAGDIVQFFYDGVDFFFPPNPEITEPVTYTIGSGQQFPDIDTAMDALKRKIIGAKGHVTLRMVAHGGPLPALGVRPAGAYPGPIVVSHPSGDRLKITGDMDGAAPTMGEFRTTSWLAAIRAQDAIYNINMLRTRYGTEIVIPDVGNGVQSQGSGLITFANLLITGAEKPFVPGATSWSQNGAYLMPA